MAKPSAFRKRSSVPPPLGLSEASAIHTRILRLALAIEESRAYWEHVDVSVPPSERAKIAFEQRWFGAKSLDRVRYVLGSFVPRYDVFPSALRVLQSWPSMDLASRQAVCHWHLQLSDPIYRRFTSECLLQRRAGREPKVDRDAVLRWVKSEYPNRWSEATCVQFASKLLSAALEAGLVSRRDPRTLSFPPIPNQTLAYLLYLLREVKFEGSLTSNPYLVSVGIDADTLAQRARSLPGVKLRRMMGLVEFDWAYPDLATWAAGEIS